MNYFIDTEFLEGTQTKRLFGFPIPTFRWNRNNKLEIAWQQTKPTIDLISIGIVAEDGRELYCISNEFNLQEAWERFQWNYGNGDERNKPPVKEYWIRDNVLRPVFDELVKRDNESMDADDEFPYTISFTYKNLKCLLDLWGDTNKSIAEQVGQFVNPTMSMEISPVFYGYFADYDWVVFCWLFGKMIDLPKGFPYYCRDIKQIMDDNNIDKKILKSEVPQINNHSALADAQWNKKAYYWIMRNKSYFQ